MPNSSYVVLFFSNRDDLTKENLGQAGVIVLACPRQRLTEGQFSILRRHVEDGGSLLVMAEEGGEKKANSNINFLLEEYGIALNNGEFELRYQ